ncbi:MAG: DMT family transporter [Hyphomicrobiales bacterium]|nr:DMT family transporter [Hyphomicrobiales bacterium]
MSTVSPSAGRFGAFEATLYAVTVFAWSTSWIAMKAQVATVAAEPALFWRFVLSATVMWGWVAVKRLPVRFPWRLHLGFAAMGFFIFSMNFDLFYHGAKGLPSGLLSVVFSLASVINLLMGRAIFGQRIAPRVLIGGLLGFSGVAAMFWPRIAGADFDAAAATGLALCVLGTTFFCTGNMLSTAIQKRGAPVISATAWGMTWAVGILGVATLISGAGFGVDLSVPWVGSLLWLSLVSSVAAFWAYLTLLGRIGAARAGYSTVMFPVFALAISTVFEGYQWSAPAVVGLLAVLSGNLFVLRR